MSTPYESFVFYSPGIIRTITIALSDMFNHLKVRRYTSDFITIKKEIDVTLYHWPLDKELIDRTEHFTTEGGERYYQRVPAVTLIFKNPTYAQNRVKSPNETREWVDATLQTPTDSLMQDYEPTPYDLNYELRIRTESMEDMQQIMEQILPYFNPDRYLRIKEFPWLNVERDVKVICSPSLEVQDSFSDEEMKKFELSLDLTVEAYLMRPFTSIAILKELFTDFAYYETQDDSQIDRKIRTYVAVDELSIPSNAVRKKKMTQGSSTFWIYTLLER